MSSRKLDKKVDSAFKFVGLAATLFGLVVLAALVVDVVADGYHRLGWEFFTSYPSRKPGQARHFFRLGGDDLDHDHDGHFRHPSGDRFGHLYGRIRQTQQMDGLYRN